MAYLITEDPNFLKSFFAKEMNDCGFGYKAFADSRTMIQFNKKSFDLSREKFKKRGNCPDSGYQ